MRSARTSRSSKPIWANRPKDSLMALLELEGIDAFYGRIQALRSVSLRVEKGEVVALIGCNGAGMTTTRRTISGLMHPGSGQIGFEDCVITEPGPVKYVAL